MAPHRLHPLRPPQSAKNRPLEARRKEQTENNELLAKLSQELTLLGSLSAAELSRLFGSSDEASLPVGSTWQKNGGEELEKLFQSTVLSFHISLKESAYKQYRYNGPVCTRLRRHCKQSQWPPSV